MSRREERGKRREEKGREDKLSDLDLELSETLLRTDLKGNASRLHPHAQPALT